MESSEKLQNCSKEPIILIEKRSDVLHLEKFIPINFESSNNTSYIRHAVRFTRLKLHSLKVHCHRFAFWKELSVKLHFTKTQLEKSYSSKICLEKSLDLKVVFS